MEDLIVKFQTIGLSEAKAKDTTKNKKLCPILEGLIDSEPLKQLSSEEKLEAGPLFYLLASTITKDALPKIDFIADQIAKKRLTTSDQVNGIQINLYIFTIY
jgi:glutaminyl-tRNA synthetase